MQQKPNKQTDGHDANENEDETGNEMREKSMMNMAGTGARGVWGMCKHFVLANGTNIESAGVATNRRMAMDVRPIPKSSPSRGFKAGPLMMSGI